MSNDSKNFDNSLYWLADSVTRAIETNEDGTIQKEQVELLMKLEERFRKRACKYAQCREIYRKFIQLVAIQNRNILSARPYFREKATTFSSQITPAIKASDIKTLQSFHINFNLMQFIKTSWLGTFPKEVEEVFAAAAEARRKLIENNLPLAINRAKLFYRKVPRGHLTLMDIISVAAMGLVSGVDKWVGEYTRVFNGVCIGRMTGNMIDTYSETTLHFYPSDRSILYRANAIRFRQNIDNLEDLAKAINKSYQEDAKTGMRIPKHKITSSQLSELLNASSPISASAPLNEDVEVDNSINVESYPDPNLNPEESLVEKDLMTRTAVAASNLPLIYQKVLKLKGVKL